MMRVLITGATGFIGSHVARHLIDEGHQVVGLEMIPTPVRIADLEDRITIVFGDVCDLEILMDTMKSYGITHVVHLAYYLPEYAIANAPTKAIRVNCEGTNKVFDAARFLGIQKVVYASTDAVCPMGPDEDDPVKPTTLYGQMKYFNEVMGRHYHRHFGLDTIGLRFGVNFGPGGRRLAGESRRKYGSAQLHQILEALMLGMTIHVDFHPQTTFAWQYVRDTASCIALALASPPTKRKVFDLPIQRRSIKELTDFLERTIPGATAVYDIGDGDESGLIVLDTTFEIDPEITYEEFGYKPQYSVEAGLSEQAAEVQKSPELYRF